MADLKTPAHVASKPAPAKRGAKPVADKTAPHGRGPDGKPLAPHGLLSNGNPRVRPQKTVTVEAAQVVAPLTDIPETLVSASKRRAPRSDAQKAMDKVVAEVYAKWVTAGKPKPADWKSLPKAAYKFKDPRDLASTKDLAKRSAALLRRRVVMGEPVRDREGFVWLIFSVVDMVKKTSK